MVPAADLDGIRKLELALLDGAVRRSPEAVAALLADEFTEFGRSGRVYSRDEVVRSLVAESGGARGIAASGFRFTVLAADVVLLTYRTAKQEGDDTLHALRGSIWKRCDGCWRMVFHQGTPTGPEA